MLRFSQNKRMCRSANSNAPYRFTEKITRPRSKLNKMRKKIVKIRPKFSLSIAKGSP